MNEDGAFWNRIKRGVVGVRTRRGDGTGWVALENDIVVTNFHVVGYEPVPQLRTVDGREVEAKVIYVSTRHDIALLMPVVALDVAPLPLGPSTEVAQGQPVAAIGHPFGLTFTVTRGVLSATCRDFDGVPHLQTDAALNPGNSGGPLIDEQGRAIGVNAFLRAGQNLGFAVPIHLFGHVLTRLSVDRSQALTIQPVYRCLGCETPFDPRSEHCVRCGRAVPGTEREPSEHLVEQDRAAVVVSRVLEQLGYVPNQLRAGENTWRVPSSIGELMVAVNESGAIVNFAIRVARLPRTGHEAVYRFLLSYNDRTSRVCRASIATDIVYLGIREPVDFLNVKAVAADVQRLQEQSARLSTILRRQFGASAPPALDSAD